MISLLLPVSFEINNISKADIQSKVTDTKIKKSGWLFMITAKNKLYTGYLSLPGIRFVCHFLFGYGDDITDK